MEIDLEEVKDTEERKDRVQELVDAFWQCVFQQYEEDFSEDEMMDLMAAVGIIIGMSLNEAFYVNHTLPYQLQGIVSDFTYQTIYGNRYGLNFEELEESRRQAH